MYEITQKGRWMYFSPEPEPWLKHLLITELSYERKGGEFMPNPDWAIVRLYQEGKHRYPIGLHTRVSDLLTKNNVVFTTRINCALEVNYEASGGLRDYQEQAINQIIACNGGILSLPTGAGKTRTACELIKHAKLPALVIVPTLEIKKQWKEQAPEGTIIRTYQSLKSKKFLQQFKLVVFDECVSGSSKIRLGDGTQKTMKEIYEDESITHVLSFNEEKNIFEPKKILRRMRQPLKEPWQKIIVEDSNGGRHQILATKNHKFWTSMGYKRVDELSTNDVLKTYLEPVKYKCEFCKKIFDRPSQLGRCYLQHKNPNAILKGNKSMHTYLKKNNLYKQNAIKAAKTRKNCPKYKESMRLMGLKRKGKNNPVFNNPETVKKISESRRKAFYNLSNEEQQKQIKIFMEAPRHRWGNKPTKPEQYIIDMDICGLEYTGKGDRMFSFSNGKKKIPDFFMRKENKVIEVGDFQYWHTKEEADGVVNEYKNVGVDCLYLDANDVCLGVCDDIIKKFCYNHDARVVSIEPTYWNNNMFRYNIEVEDNHNYIANNILISNCHTVAAKSLQLIGLNLCEEAVVVGLSATPFMRDGDNMKVEAVLGPIVYKVTLRSLIKQGHLCNARVYYHPLKKHDITPFHTYAMVVSEYIVHNDERNKKIASLASSGYTLVLVDKIEHGEVLHKLIPDSKFLHGKSKDRGDTDYRVIIATSIYDMGVDIPRMQTLILAGGGKSAIRTTQRIGRVLRPYPGKSHAVVHDFVDRAKWLFVHYEERRKIFEKDFQVIDV